ncbi:MAG TPA: nuclear transport factor 2 family protein [Thermoanaerobaculia bacterium]|nr:nuclear transport factor 2 family protein [Thermoanaerobaculia bacterium]
MNIRSVCVPLALAVLAASPPAVSGLAAFETVERYVRAYNKHDAESIAALVDPDLRVQRLGEEKPTVSGRDGLREFFRAQFREHPKASMKVVRRMELGVWVVTEDRTTLDPGEAAHEALTVYEVGDGFIRRLWYMEPGDEKGDLAGGDGVVALQVEKWNEKDLPRLLTAYDPGASVQRLSTGERLAAGEDALRERFEKIFDESPHLHKEVRERMSLGPWVVYKEQDVIGTDDRREESIIAYEVRDGVIRRVWLLP